MPEGVGYPENFDKRPGPGVTGQPQASPDEQETFDLVVSQAMHSIHGEKTRDKILKQLGAGPTPAQAVGKIAGQLGLMAWRSAKETGNAARLSQEVMGAAGAEIVEQLIELGQVAGLFQLQSEDEATKMAEQAMLEATRIYGEALLASGDVDRAAASHQLQQEIAREQKGMQPRPVAAGVRSAIQGAQGAPGGAQGAPAPAQPPGMQGPRPGLVQEAMR